MLDFSWALFLLVFICKYLPLCLRFFCCVDSNNHMQAFCGNCFCVLVLTGDHLGNDLMVCVCVCTVTITTHSIVDLSCLGVIVQNLYFEGEKNENCPPLYEPQF